MTQPMKRTDVTELVMEAKIKKGLSWTKIARAVGASKEWTTAALLGQMQMTKAQAVAAGKMLGLPPYAVLLVQQVPYKGSIVSIIFQMGGGLRASMHYCGCTTIDEMHSKAEFVEISSAGIRESHTHGVLITRESPNYPGVGS